MQLVSISINFIFQRTTRLCQNGSFGTGYRYPSKHKKRAITMRGCSRKDNTRTVWLDASNKCGIMDAMIAGYAQIEFAE